MGRYRLAGFGIVLLAGCFIIPLTMNVWFETHKLVRVVLLAGDDNVEGYAQLSHLSTFMDKANNKTLERFQHLRSRENHSEWTTRDDVFVFYERERHKPWHVGTVNMHDYGAKPGLFGPEVEVANVLGEAFDEPVVLVKAGFTEKSLAEDWISPSRQTRHLPVGFTWMHTLANLKHALQNMDQVLGPEYKKHRTQLVGIIWWHGYSDARSSDWLDAYHDNLKALIRDFRIELERPHLPIVIAEAGAAGHDIDAYFFERPLRVAQERVCNDTDFREAQTKCVPTHPYVHSQEKHLDRHFHYYGHGDSMIEISGVLADALLDLYFKQYEQDELQEEIESDFSGDVNETESYSVVFLLGIAGLIFLAVAVVQGRCSSRTVAWNWNRLFYTPSNNLELGGVSDSESIQSDGPEQSKDSSTGGQHRRRRRRRKRASPSTSGVRRVEDGTIYAMTELTPTTTVYDPKARTLEEGETFDSMPESDSALLELDEISSSEDEE
ncbi:hypothetical protein ACA910_008612 [Epithemia clementina (nom. ined.)]